jgi:hypothetical protein
VIRFSCAMARWTRFAQVEPGIFGRVCRIHFVGPAARSPAASSRHSEVVVAAIKPDRLAQVWMAIRAAIAEKTTP